jgi:ubiquinone/menaquinone biosynthesis C-methylase UbiE
MGKIRKPFQGVGNIIRFNWHFYVLSLSAIIFLLILANYLNENYKSYLYLFCFFIFLPIFISLCVSYYVYDVSKLYSLNWIDDSDKKINIININAGFDETSVLLKEKFAFAQLAVLDFYDSTKHTEISIMRARNAYPPHPNTITVTTNQLPFEDNSADKIFVIFAAHEIRNDEERIVFFKELKRILKPNGQIIVTEHLRDIPNFLAYNIGFLHFYSKQTWIITFLSANLNLKKEQKITSFISTFTLTKNGTTA